MRMKYALPLLGAGVFLALQGAAWASEGGGGHHELNWFDFGLRFICFAIMVAILYKLLNKPVGNLLSKRQDDIRQTLAELELKQKEAEEKSAEFKAKLATLEVETRKIVDELIAEGETERQKIIEAAHKQAEYIRQQAQISVLQEVKAAKESLRDEVSEMSVKAAEDLLRKKMKAKDQDRLVKDFMTRVVEAK